MIRGIEPVSSDVPAAHYYTAQVRTIRYTSVSFWTSSPGMLALNLPVK
jgi:hypothetical protein